MSDEFTLNYSGIREYIKIDARGTVTQRLFVYDNGRGGGGGSGGGGGGGGGGGSGGGGSGGGSGGGGSGRSAALLSTARVPELVGSRASVPELVSTARVPELVGSRASVPELVSTARVPELLRRPGGRRTRKNKNRKQ